MSVHDFPFTIRDAWKRAESIREDAAAKARRERESAQRIGRLPVLELADLTSCNCPAAPGTDCVLSASECAARLLRQPVPPRNPDGTQAEWCALLNTKPGPR